MSLRSFVRLIWLLLPLPLAAQQLIRFTGNESPLAKRWAWAQEEAVRQAAGEEFWIAYCIERLMDENSFITTGMYFTGSIDHRSSLYDLILEGKEDSSQFLGRQKKSRGSSQIHRGRRTPFKVMKEVGIFVHYSSARPRTIEDIQTCNLELSLNLRRAKIFWLGSALDEESVALLTELFAQVKDPQIRESIVNAVGIHQQSKKVFPFLKRILASEEAPKVRSQAAFWIGTNADPEALDVLVEVAHSEAPNEVMEQVVFAISQIDSEAALDQLINLARKARDSNVRRKATFWLGQKASQKAVSTLEEMIVDDGDTEVQRQALFALANIPGGGGIERLISVAKNHPKAKIRKQAIMSLGQSDDPRARDALIEIARAK